MEKLPFLMQISKVHITIYNIEGFQDLKLSAIKWRPFQYNVKFETNISFITVLRSISRKRLWKNIPF